MVTTMNTEILNPTIETPVIDTPANEAIDQQQSQSIAVKIACLSFFPLLYVVGKAVVTFLG